MLIPMLASFITSVLLVNLVFLSNSIFPASQEITGRVLGAVEKVEEVDLTRLLPIPAKVTAGLSNSAAGETGPVRSAAAGDFILSARSGIAVDLLSGRELFSKQADQPLPIASITKLMTALVFLDHNPGWETVYQIKESDRREGGRIYLFTGEQVRARDLFYLTLVASANTATEALVNSTGLTRQEFVAHMNNKAQELNLRATKFFDPAGLDPANVSTAREIAVFSRIALANYEIRQASLSKSYQFKTLDGRDKLVYSTDSLLTIFPQNGISLLGGKTGFIEASGYCFVGWLTNRAGQEVITVILGADSNQERFSQTKALVEWVYASYNWQ